MRIWNITYGDDSLWNRYTTNVCTDSVVYFLCNWEGNHRPMKSSNKQRDGELCGIETEKYNITSVGQTERRTSHDHFEKQHIPKKM